MTRIVKLPEISMLKGDPDRDMNPISALYCVVLGPMFLNDHIGVDAMKIKMNRIDARRLFTLLKQYTEDCYPDLDAGDVAAKLWMKIGPTPTDSVPQGYVYLDKGYIILGEGTQGMTI